MPINDAGFAELTTGRVVIGALDAAGELLQELTAFCRREDIRAGLFSVSGTVQSATLGSYDPRQQVVATRRENGSFEILSCTGAILPGKEAAALWARIVLCTEDGRTTGGRLLSPTLFDHVDFVIRELLGELPERVWDPFSGRMRLHFR